MLLLSPFAVHEAHAGDVIEGPVAADVVRVVDGDTLKLKVHVWIGQTIEVDVRVAGIDAPELKGKCPAERARAEEARDYLDHLVGGRAVRIAQVRNDKYGGRVIADVNEETAGDIGTAMLARGLARAYGGGKREPWCQAAS
ncbi:MAG: thermonuclease family protein [Parvibaculum sp.]|nr:thermonuclease family protein [Parvibaculum sp.]